MATYIMYRNTTLGEALQKTLDDMISDDLITAALAQKVLAAYDRAINKALSKMTKHKMSFKADRLRAYRYCDNVWTFLMERVDFRDGVIDGGPINRVKFVACDGTAKPTA